MRVLTCAALVLLGLNGHPAAASDGALVLVGGGPTPADVFERTLKLSGERRAIVAVVPQTFPDDSLADAAVALWRGLRVAEVIKVSRTDSVAAQQAIERATLIWIPGGYPSYLVRSIRATPIPGLIRARFAAGVTIGGASAGAVAMSSTMLADDAAPDGSANGSGPTEDGLGLWPEAIVSPHFTERRRLTQLVNVVQVRPDLYGIGLDEGTAVIVRSGAFDVVGRGRVSVLEPGRPGVRLLRAGDRYRYRPRTR